MYLLKKQFSRTSLVACIATLLLSVPVMAAVEFTSSTDGHGQVTVAGTSTLHDWDVNSSDVRGTLSIEADSFTLEAFADANVEAEIRIPVRALTSENRGMDRRMYNALEASDYEEVVFVLKALSAVDLETLGGLAEFAEADALAVMATGDLTITGTTHEIELPALVYWDGAALKIEVKTVIVMSEYGIDPPRALMGTIRTGDEVTVHVVWTPELIQ